MWFFLKINRSWLTVYLWRLGGTLLLSSLYSIESFTYRSLLYLHSRAWTMTCTTVHIWLQLLSWKPPKTKLPKIRIFIEFWGIISRENNKAYWWIKSRTSSCTDELSCSISISCDRNLMNKLISIQFININSIYVIMR